MCPVCLATAAIIAGSATGTGGLSALVVAKILQERSGNTISRNNRDAEEDRRWQRA